MRKQYPLTYNPIIEYYNLIESGQEIVSDKVRRIYKKLVKDIYDTGWAGYTPQSGGAFNFKLLGGAKTTPFVNSTLKSKIKSVPFTMQGAKLYISASLPAGTSISPKLTPNNGVNYETMSLISQRADPKFSGFVEYEYQLNFVNSGSMLGLLVDLLPSSGSSPVIKKYGLHVY